MQKTSHNSESQKTIVFVINSLKYGGAENVFVMDANMLHKKGYNVHIVVLYGTKDDNPRNVDLELPESQIHYLQFLSWHSVHDLVRLRKLLKQFPQCKVYSTLDEANAVCRLVALVSRFELYCREANLPDQKPRVFKAIDILTSFRVTQVVAVAHVIVDQLHAYMPWLRRVSVLHNGVMRAENPRDYSKHQGQTIVTVGSLTSKKHHAMLIEAFARIHADFPNARVRIVGEGNLLNKLQDQAHTLGMQEYVMFAGLNPKVEEEYNQADIFVLTSKREGCPNVLLEAMAHGLACISTNVGAVPEIIEDNVSGIIIANKDTDALTVQLKNLLAHPGQVRSLGKGAYERMKTFSWEVHIETLQAIMQLYL